ncbi:glutaminase [Microbacterium xanthum]|uniref:glutaminase n=1 Tax=Microbacterium xanthum TaxID=3079794 RepID=UPI002AD408F3|nr:glutaminase [Microbacterium sp. KSW-48]MDZ8171597.1 glutaminase [Microbacterium sp. KSW-48]
MSIARVFDDARARLNGCPREQLGEVVEPRRVLGVRRAPRIVPHGDAWHLGVLLLSDDAVLAVGEVVRSREEARRGFAAESQRDRAALAAAAFRGGFPEGVAVHVGWDPVDLDAVERGSPSGPLAMIDGVPSVRWSPAAGFAPLAGYLEDRIALLLDPPRGAS